MPKRFKVGDLDTSYLKFDPNAKDFLQKIRRAIPAFAEFKSEYAQTDEMIRRIFAWVVIMYDIESPLRGDIKGLYQRKTEAATLCELTPNTISGRYKKYVEDMLLGQCEEVNNLIVKYISYQPHPDYIQLIAHKVMQDSTMNKIMAGKADHNTLKVFDATTEKIKELTNLIYGSGERDEVTEARMALYRQVSYDLSLMRPESVAKAFAEGEGIPDTWGPYERGYEPGDIKFVGDDPSIAEGDEE